MHWRIGNGNNDSIAWDPWIPNDGNSKPSWVDERDKDKKLSLLLNTEESWNKALVRDMFLPKDAIDIINIPASLRVTRDEIFLHFDKRGISPLKVLITYVLGRAGCISFFV